MKTVFVLAAAAAIGVSLPAAAQTAPDVYDKCFSNVNGIGDALYARSCANASAFGAAGGGQYSGNSASIGNGHVDAATTYSYPPGTASTSWSDQGWSNRVDVTSNTGGVASASSSLVDGTLHGFVSNPNSFFHGGFVNTRISDVITFNNLSGAAVALPVGYAFDGQFTPGPNGFDGYTEGFVYLALGTPYPAPQTIRFAASGQLIGGGARSYFNAVWDSLQNSFSGDSRDAQFTGSFDVSTGMVDGTFGTTLLIPTGVSTMGFAFTLNLDCRVTGGTCDFDHTGALDFGALPSGLSYTSASGKLFAAAAGVPEPATWAMMILGFAVTGAAVRARRLRPALA